MLLRILSIGTKMPDWVQLGYAEYAKRFPPGFRLELHEIPTIKRTKNSVIKTITEEEGLRLLKLTHPTHRLISLDLTGKSYTTKTLAHDLEKWYADNQSIDFLIGGPDGLSELCLQRSHQKWSLSPLTFPHPLVRIILVEQLYRAISLIHNHPYHR